ncbi:HNH endonuclease [Ancylobacter sp. MQZ15Z-1]|uniref:HNH endonuclease n=1 Tax=Ancylobacter mangrovi TaxID=2972472 RepID=A0A9X2PFR9_9HYPH|nr:HNH endonuclease signature motif containing protein [Ancylobacter mangrovi]MCS0497876.1 HNH endonuclease [Ancylobacter mangrovi]
MNEYAGIGRKPARARGYDGRWERARAQFLAEHPWCVRCAEQGTRTAATVVDHIIPHRYGQARTPEEKATALRLLRDPDNWQGLCSTHHSSTKQREERSGGRWGSTVDGRPIDPSHPWNRR